eukprot:jgi/Tetstr1/433928/TSEL_023105.t1
MAGLKTYRDNSTLKLLLNELEVLNGGRWHVLSTDAGNKHVADFSSPTRDSLISDLSDRITHRVPCISIPDRLADAQKGEPKNYATAGVYGLAHDAPYVRRKHLGVEVDFDFLKRLGSMSFQLRRCASEFGAVDDFSLVSESDDLEAWAFQLVFWEPCKCMLMQPFAYDFFRAWVWSEQGRGSIVDCRIPVMLNTSRSVDTSEGKWMAALEFYTPLLCTKDPADQPHSVVLACPTLIDSDDRNILGHLGKFYRTGEESMYGHRFSIKPGSRDVAGHELRVSIDSLTDSPAIARRR